jgi:hypothetical protein
VCRTCFASQQFQFFEKKREEKEQKIAEQIKAHEEQRRIDELIKAGKKLKRCIKCQIVRDANDYYNTRAVCKECVKEHERSYRRTREAKLKLERGLGIQRVIKSKPGEYNNEYEQIATKELLTSIGWSFNEENNIFYKEGIKDKNGKWDNVKEDTPTISIRGDFREAAKNLTIDTIPRIKLKFRTHKSISEDLLNIVIREHIINNMKVSEIAKKYNVPYMSVHGWIDLLYDRLKEDKT